MEHPPLTQFAFGNRQEAIELYRRSADPGFSYELFRAAGAVRDQHVGRNPWWSAGISAILPCELTTLCTYCTFFTQRAAASADIVAAARAIAELGIRHLHLSGGTRMVDPDAAGGGYDREMIALVQAIRAEVDIDIEVNVGPALTRSGMRELKACGVSAVTSSLEVTDPEVFARFKPGDSLSGRIRLMEICEEEEMPIRSMMLIGLGETEAARIDHLLFLQRFRMLTHLRMSRYMPFPGAASKGLRCSPWPVARLTAIARLMFPAIDLGLAAGNGPDDYALWWMAGGGNQILGASASMKDPRGKGNGEAQSITVGERTVVHNNMAQITRYLAELGLTPRFAPPV